MIRPVLVIDFGTTSLRFSIVSATGDILEARRVVLPNLAGKAGEVAWDGDLIATTLLAETKRLAEEWNPLGIAIANQRVSCLLWDRTSGRVMGPVLSWSDLRTAAFDRALRKSGSGHIPNLTGSKLRWLLDQVDPDRKAVAAGTLRAGTLDSFIISVLSGGQTHVTDFTNAAQSGLLRHDTLCWDEALANVLGVPLSILPEPVPSVGPHGVASAIDAGLPVLGMIGDQQGSLLGQGCTEPRQAKLTFGTVGVLNVVVGREPIAVSSRAAFSNIAYSDKSGVTYGTETSIQSAGSAIEWLVRIGILPSPAAIDDLVDPSILSERIVFVQALHGLGAPHWKPGARGAFLGLSAADGREAMVRAVLDSIVCATADALDCLEGELGVRLDRISVDGGLAASSAFRSILSATLRRDLVQSANLEATTLGAARLGFTALGEADAFRTAPPQPIVSLPGTIPADRDRARRATELVMMELSQGSGERRS
ncbi:FGGY family carbohydrate kinase [Bradyrhizobium sp.]|uniref:FGGY family carbohydrate kinase n=1 Tax=Bradyrhizobium sp. TaxID=376 RepID=UPI0039E3B6C3